MSVRMHPRVKKREVQKEQLSLVKHSRQCLEQKGIALVKVLENIKTEHQNKIKC